MICGPLLLLSLPFFVAVVVSSGDSVFVGVDNVGVCALVVHDC